jgi:hypothetical protein
MFDSMVAAGVYRHRNYGMMVHVSKRMKDNLLFWGKVRSNAAISMNLQSCADLWLWRWRCECLVW